MKANQADHRVATMCRVLGVSSSGYYAWLRRGRSVRARRDGELSARIAFHRDSRGTYGVPRVHAELAEDGERVARKRVARLMHGQRRWTRTTLRDGAETPVPDLVERDFTASRPNALWVADATYIPTWEGSCSWRWWSTCTAPRGGLVDLPAGDALMLRPRHGARPARCA